MRSTKICTIKHNNTFLGIKQTNNNYLLGFYFYDHATSIVKKVGTTPSVLLKQGQRQNISRNIKLSLLEMNLPIYKVQDNVYLDNNAHIAFKKINDVATNNAEIVEMTFEKFISLPFSNNFGIIMPYQFVQENDEYIMYKANVIDRFYSVE